MALPVFNNPYQQPSFGAAFNNRDLLDSLSGFGNYGNNSPLGMPQTEVPSILSANPVVNQAMSLAPTAPINLGGAASKGMFGGLFDNLLGSTDANGVKTDGWGGAALGLAQGGLSAFMGMKQYGIAKQSLEESKRQFDMNYGAQKTTTNSALEDRQRARVASNPGAYQSVSDYMNQNGIR